MSVNKGILSQYLYAGTNHGTAIMLAYNESPVLLELHSQAEKIHDPNYDGTIFECLYKILQNGTDVVEARKWWESHIIKIEEELDDDFHVTLLSVAVKMKRIVCIFSTAVINGVQRPAWQFYGDCTQPLLILHPQDHSHQVHGQFVNNEYVRVNYCPRLLHNAETDELHSKLGELVESQKLICRERQGLGAASQSNIWIKRENEDVLESPPTKKLKTENQRTSAVLTISSISAHQNNLIHKKGIMVRGSPTKAAPKVIITSMSDFIVELDSPMDGNHYWKKGKCKTAMPPRCFKLDNKYRYYVCAVFFPKGSNDDFEDRVFFQTPESKQLDQREWYLKHRSKTYDNLPLIRVGDTVEFHLGYKVLPSKLDQRTVTKAASVAINNRDTSYIKMFGSQFLDFYTGTRNSTPYKQPSPMVLSSVTTKGWFGVEFHPKTDKLSENQIVLNMHSEFYLELDSPLTFTSKHRSAEESFPPLPCAGSSGSRHRYLLAIESCSPSKWREKAGRLEVQSHRLAVMRKWLRQEDEKMSAIPTIKIGDSIRFDFSVVNYSPIMVMEKFKASKCVFEDTLYESDIVVIGDSASRNQGISGPAYVDLTPLMPAMIPPRVKYLEPNVDFILEQTDEFFKNGPAGKRMPGGFYHYHVCAHQIVFSKHGKVRLSLYSQDHMEQREWYLNTQPGQTKVKDLEVIRPGDVVQVFTGSRSTACINKSNRKLTKFTVSQTYKKKFKTAGSKSSHSLIQKEKAKKKKARENKKPKKKATKKVIKKATEKATEKATKKVTKQATKKVPEKAKKTGTYTHICKKKDDNAVSRPKEVKKEFVQVKVEVKKEYIQID